MFSYLDDVAFIEFVLERGNIPFVVHGDLSIKDGVFEFGWGIHVSGPPIG